MTTHHVSDPETAAIVQASMRWHGWGSPIGLGLFIMCVAVAGLLAANAVATFTGEAAKAKHTALELPASGR